MFLVDKAKESLYYSLSGKAPRGMGHGPFSEGNSGWVDNKPYNGYWSNGLFEGYDGSMVLYMAFPDDVQVRWLSEDASVLDTQGFFVDAMRDLSSLFSSQEDKLRSDVRREFHIQITQDQEPFKAPPGTTPAHADYLERLQSQYTKPVWRSYFGVELIPASLFDKKYSWRDKVEAYVDAFFNAEQVNLRAFERDLENVRSILAKHGFRSLDFSEHPEDFERLTSWYGVPDEQFARSKQLQNARLLIPAHNRSVITPRWGEVYMSALRPSERLDFLDPESPSANTRWAGPLLSPASGVVCVNIRGQIRSDDVADNLLDVRESRKTAASGTGSGSLTYGQVTKAGRAVIQRRHLPLLDNTEIIVASLVPKSKQSETPLEKLFSKTGIEIAMLEDRQDKAILSTLPTYPDHVMRVPRGNSKRPHLANAFFPGVLAFSTLFQADKPLAPGGIQLGLGDGQYQEIYVELDATSRLGGSPIWLISGKPGSGKTQAMLNYSAQAVMSGAFCAYFNPKQTGTLKPTFDYLGGVTISMSRQYLLANPGLADPFFFLKSREDIAALIADAIATSMKMYSDKGSESAARRTKLMAEVKARAENPANRTAYDVIFGNTYAGTKPLSDSAIVDFVRDKVQTSPFWRSFLAPPNSASTVKDKLDAARAILFEWDESMSLPDTGKNVNDFTDNEVDTTLSLVTMFRYAVAKARTNGSNSMIICDESHVLKASPEAMKIVERAGREWREANINLLLGTQEMRDFLDDENGGDGKISSFIGRYIIMAIAEKSTRDLELFFEVTRLPNEHKGEPQAYAKTRYGKYITSAASGKSSGGKRVFRAYLVDHIYGYSGGIIVGPWPERELSIGRTDKDAVEARRRNGTINKTYEEMLEDKERQGNTKVAANIYSAEAGGFGGFLSGIAQTNSDTKDGEEAKAAEQEMAALQQSAGSGIVSGSQIDEMFQSKRIDAPQSPRGGF